MALARRLAKVAFAAADVGRARRPGPRLLIYHQVGTSLGREMEVSAEDFRRHLDLLEEEGRIVPLEEALVRRGEPDADRCFVLTFDDGYADVHTHAFPLLAERGLPFTLYLTTAPIEEEVAGFGHPDAVPLRWAQVNEMVATGLVTLGAHTHTHPDLRLLDRERVATELERSNELIERRTGIRPRHFAYPKGWWAPAAEPEIVARYDSAVLGAGPPVTAATPPHRIHRVAVQRSDTLGFLRRKLATGMVLEEWVRRRLQGYRGPTD